MRRLKLEKTDLHMQNLEIKREILVSKSEQDQKDEEVWALQEEILRFKK